ncbi:adenosylmethionine decarboxylase [Haloplasma contractile]|uniref:Adenosylmethionine decarboxylase n=1 Tax=Haloplasma contractile SSD-17B TaxID=1033810 RepID=U2EC14_9MOLU|nr:adenosylmethionine decarboxylase [Haloplasma contractile]ERJ12336.1 S-adenosylmethionine decarboxylase proenzyme protein [Haloplasma contractile SSD-17B]
MEKNKSEKITLYGFNNLTKTLSFNIYDICYTKTEADRNAYIEYIDEQYNSERLTKILTEVTHMIGASVLNIAKQDYDPQGASVTLLISEEEVPVYVLDPSCNQGQIMPRRDSVVGHLDKSHVTVHTYPESHPDNNISTFRVDIDVSTCGMISPIKALDYLIKSFDSDVITIDYRVRGFTRDVDGTKHYLDHNINSIQDYIQYDLLKRYNLIDVNLHHSNIFHTKMMLQDFNLDNYLFNLDSKDLSEEDRYEIKQRLNREMVEIFYGMNIPDLTRD